MPSVYEEITDLIKRRVPDFAPRNPKEVEQAYLKRVLNALSGPQITDDDYFSLSEKTANWADNAIAEELNKGRDITPPPGFESAVPSSTRTRVRPTPVIVTAAEAEVRAEPEVQKAEVEVPPRDEEDEGEEEEEESPAVQSPDASISPAVGAGVTVDAPPQKRRGRAPSGTNGTNGHERRTAEPGRKQGGVRKKFSMQELRRMVVENPDIDVNVLAAAAENHDEKYPLSTIKLARYQTLSVLKLVQELGHWKD